MGAVKSARHTLTIECSRYLFQRLGARAVETGDVSDIAQFVVAPIAGGTFVAVGLLIFVCCFRMRKSPKREDMGTNNPVPVAERPPWAA